MSGPAIILAALALAGQPDGELGARIAQSAAAAQALQGPLDGNWVLADRKGRERFVLQIVDRAGGGGPLQAAWREAADTGEMGPVAMLQRSRSVRAVRDLEHVADDRGVQRARIALSSRGGFGAAPCDWRAQSGDG